MFILVHWRLIRINLFSSCRAIVGDGMDGMDGMDRMDRMDGMDGMDRMDVMVF